MDGNFYVIEHGKMAVFNEIRTIEDFFNMERMHSSNMMAVIQIWN